MKTKLNQFYPLVAAGALAFAATPAIADHGSRTNSGYLQFNLVSDISTNAFRTDARLLNPWGLAAGPGSIWVNDNHSGLTTVYGPSGRRSDFAINIPAPGGGPAAPTGLVFNDTSKFVISNGNRHDESTFVMSTEDGTLTAWSQRISGPDAVIVATTPDAVYKGLALARDTNGAPHIYAANFHGGVVDVFDGQFQYVSSFTDSNLPPNFAPFNVRNIRGKLFVTFALQKLPDAEDDQAGPGNGYIDIFDTDGTMLRHFASQGVLNSPWGLAVAPANFGKFSRALLVGNFGDGTINAFDLLSGKSLGPLTQPNGDPIVIAGLWALSFERDEVFDRECEFNAQRLYFTAGPNDEEDGLLGLIQPVSPFFRRGD
jgi:uncharacterized protein (TIGR03118 family)